MCRFFGFVSEGYFRAYRVDTKGQEHLIHFAVENWWVGDRESYITDDPSNSHIDAIEQSEMILFQEGDFKILYTKIPDIPHNSMYPFCCIALEMVDGLP